MTYIEKEVLLKDIGKIGGHLCSGWDTAGVLNVIYKQPEIDAVPVVRCKNCLHYEFGVCMKIYSDGAVSQYAWQERKPDDFCSYGKRTESYGWGGKANA